MTIASEIQRIQTNIANAYDALEAKGATMPATENTDNLVTTIDTISGGGDIVTATNNTGNQILAGDKVWMDEGQNSSIMLPAPVSLNTANNPYFLFVMSPDESKVYFNKTETNSSGIDISTLTEDGGSYERLNCDALTYLQNGSIVAFRHGGDYNVASNSLDIGNNEVSLIDANKVTLNNGCYMQGYSFYTQSDVPIITGHYQAGLSICFSWKNSNNEYAIYNGAESYSNAIKFVSITDNGNTVTNLATGPEITNYMNCAGITKDNKLIVFDRQGIVGSSGNDAIKILRVNYIQNSITDVTSSVLPASFSSLITNSCKTVFNPNTGILWGIAANENHLNTMIVCRYNESTSQFDDITNTIEIPSGLIIYSQGGLNVSGDLKKVAFTNNYNPNVYPAAATLFVIKTEDTYSIENFDDFEFFNIFGSPTIDNSTHIASGFSTTNYLNTLKDFNPGSLSWEIKSKVTTGSDISSPQGFLCQYHVYNRIVLGITGDHFWCLLSSDNSNWDIMNYTSSQTVSANTSYWLKLSFDGSSYILGYSTNGTSFTTLNTVSNSTPIYQTNLPLTIGANDYSNGVNIPWLGSIDLSETYINVNGVLSWKPYFPSITKDSLMGYAQENIASGSTGEVLTLIQPQYYAYKDFLNRYVYCKNLITSTDFYYDLNARSDNKKASDISELTVPTRSKPKSVTSTSVTFNTMPYYRTEQDDLY